MVQGMGIFVVAVSNVDWNIKLLNVLESWKFFNDVTKIERCLEDPDEELGSYDDGDDDNSKCYNDDNDGVGNSDFNFITFYRQSQRLMVCRRWIGTWHVWKWRWRCR